MGSESDGDREKERVGEKEVSERKQEREGHSV